MPRLRELADEINKPEFKLTIKLKKKLLRKIWVWLKKNCRRN